MSRLDSIQIEKAVDAATAGPGRDLGAMASAQATAGLGEALGGWQEIMQGRAMRAALTGSKVLLFNAAVFGPVFALLALLGAF